MLLFFALYPSQASAHKIGQFFDAYKVGDQLDLDKLEFLDKGGFDLKKRRGKKRVVLIFWSLYFKHNQETLRFSSKLYNHFKKSNVAFLGVNLDSKWEIVEKEIKKYGLSFTHTCNPYLTFPYKLLGAISKDGGSVIIIDKTGKIALVWQLIEEEDYNDIKKFLNQNRW